MVKNVSDVTNLKKGRPSRYGQTSLVSLRLEKDVVSVLSHRYHVNINAQVNYYLSTLLMNLCLFEGTPKQKELFCIYKKA